MILSTRGRYAVMAMVELGAQDSEKPLSLACIAERQEIPLAYLEQIFAKLRKAELVSSVRGPGGGYHLARPAQEMTVAEIIHAAEESIKMTRCSASSEKGCMSPKTRCLTHDLWEGLSEQIHQYLDGISLQDVCERNLPPRMAGLIQEPRPLHDRHA